MAGLLGGILDEAKKAGADALAEAQRKAARDATKATTDAVHGAAASAAGTAVSAFKGTADVAAIVKPLPDKFDPRTSPEMSKAIKHLLGAPDNVAAKPLDGRDLEAMNRFLKAQGSKPMESWEDLKKADLTRLIENGSNGARKIDMGKVVAELNAGVKEISGTAPATPASAPSPDAPASSASPVDAAKKAAGGLLDAGKKLWDRIPKADPNAPKPPDVAP